jgi:hypothetical protein
LAVELGVGADLREKTGAAGGTETRSKSLRKIRQIK